MGDTEKPTKEQIEKRTNTRLGVAAVFIMCIAGISQLVVLCSKKTERCDSISNIEPAQRKKEIKKAAEEHCGEMIGTEHIAPGSLSETYIAKDCVVEADITTKGCKGSATIIIKAEDEYGSQKPWKVMRRVGFTCDYGAFSGSSQRKWEVEGVFLPYIEEKKIVGVKNFLRSKWNEAKQGFSYNSGPLPLPSKFQRPVQPMPRHSMPMKIPRKAC